MHLDKLQWIWHVGSNVAGAPGGGKYNYAVAVIINACPSLVPQDSNHLCDASICPTLLSSLVLCLSYCMYSVLEEATESEEENKVGGGRGGGGGGKGRGSIYRLLLVIIS